MRDLGFAAAGALIWTALIDHSGAMTALFGALLGWGLGRCFFGAGNGGRPIASPLRRAAALLRLLARFSQELVVANLEQLRIVLAPRVRVKPQWLVYRTVLRDPRLRLALGLMISLTPGTVTADLEGSYLMVHVLDSDDPGRVELRIRQRFESVLQELDRR